MTFRKDRVYLQKSFILVFFVPGKVKDITNRKGLLYLKANEQILEGT